MEEWLQTGTELTFDPSTGWVGGALCSVPGTLEHLVLTWLEAGGGDLVECPHLHLIIHFIFAIVEMSGWKSPSSPAQVIGWRWGRDHKLTDNLAVGK